MKKFLPHIIIIVVLAGVSAFLLLHKTNSGDAEGDFAVHNRKSIYKILLESTDKKKIELTQPGGVWMVNGKYPAREELIQTILETVSELSTQGPVPNAAHDNVLREMLAKSIKVEIYAGKEEKPIKTYYVGGPTVNDDGTYMLQEIDGKMASRPYITYVPNFHGYLTPRFSTDEETWRSKVLFNYEGDEIKNLSVEYPADEKSSFVINRVAKDSFTLEPKDPKFAIKDVYQQNFIRQYLNFFSNISFEAYDNKFTAKDSTLKTTPYCIFTITEQDSSVNKVRIYYMPISKRSKSQFDLKGNELTYDIDHYHASIHDDKDFVIMQYYVIGKLLRSYKDFYFKKEGSNRS